LTNAAEDPLCAAACRARAVGDIADFAECLTQELDNCAHGIHFGHTRFCWHPRHREIVARTSRSA
jgi:hypothetical protein